MENIGTLRLMRSHLQAVRINDDVVIDKQNGTGGGLCSEQVRSMLLPCVQRTAML
jgi:hypothetical protein